MYIFSICIHQTSPYIYLYICIYIDIYIKPVHISIYIYIYSIYKYGPFFDVSHMMKHMIQSVKHWRASWCSHQHGSHAPVNLRKRFAFAAHFNAFAEHFTSCPWAAYRQPIRKRKTTLHDQKVSRKLSFPRGEQKKRKPVLSVVHVRPSDQTLLASRGRRRAERPARAWPRPGLIEAFTPHYTGAKKKPTAASERLSQFADFP